MRRMDIMDPIHVPDLAVPSVDDHATATSQAFLADLSAHEIQQRQAECIRAQRFGNPVPVHIRLTGKLISDTECNQLHRNATLGQMLCHREIRHVHAAGSHEVARNQHSPFHC